MFAHRPRLVTLLSNWSSGATLFTILVDAHSQIVSNGESMPFSDDDYDRYDCSCGAYLDKCDFYKSAASHMRCPENGEWDRSLFVHVPRFSRNPVLQSLLGSWRFDSATRDRIIRAIPAYRDTRDRFMEAQLRFFARARDLAGASLYMDGTKSIRRAQLFARGGRCDMKVIHLLRDGRGFCCSYMKHQSLGEATPTTIRASANAWLGYISQVDKFARAFPSIPLLTLRYEDLCRSTSESIATVCRFLDVEYEELAVTGRDNMHLLGNKIRRGFDGHISEDTSWKERLSRNAQAELTDLMRPQLERFGYT